MIFSNEDIIGVTLRVKENSWTFLRHCKNLAL